MYKHVFKQSTKYYNIWNQLSKKKKQEFLDFFLLENFGSIDLILEDNTFKSLVKSLINRIVYRLAAIDYYENNPKYASMVSNYKDDLKNLAINLKEYLIKTNLKLIK